MIADVDATILGYEKNIQDLRKKLLEGVAVQTGLTVVRIMNIVDHIGRSSVLRLLVRQSLMQNTAEMIDIDILPHADGARFQWEKGCLSGTRKTFLEEICNILNNPDDGAP